MFSTEMKGMAKEPEERSGALFDAVVAVAEAVEEAGFSCEGGGPNANEREDGDDEDDDDVDVEDDEEVEEDDDDVDGRLSELDLRKLLMSELVERVRAESVEALRGEKTHKHNRCERFRSLSTTISQVWGGVGAYVRMPLGGSTPVRSEESEEVSGRKTGAGAAKGEGSGS
jgi:hypothetical protein